MSFLDDVKKTLNDSSPYFKAEVLKEYTFQFIGYRLLQPGDDLYREDSPTYEFTLLDIETGKEKIWTTSSRNVLQQMIDEGIQEKDYFTVTKTGETGKGKKYWVIKKVDKPI